MTNQLSSRYEFNPEIGVHLPRHDVEPFWFSDGTAEELRLEQVLHQTADRSIGSADLLPHITNWQTEYHLSSARANLLRVFDYSRAARVLELGAGCGALTRFWGELGLDVTAIEGSARRARIAALRCHDLPNVSVVADRFEQFETDTGFDIVTLVGVLEYASIAANEPEPFLRCLERSRAWLAPGGRLVLAIENRLGLKYLNGHCEDHHGKPFWGISGLSAPGEADTFGHRELQQLLARAGFSHVEFYYPFPDYKLPTIVLSDLGLNEPGFAAGELLLRNSSRTYAGTPAVLFDESLVRLCLSANGLIGPLANSFLVIAGTDVSSCIADRTWLAKQFSRGSGRRPGATRPVSTRFDRRDSGIVVSKSDSTELEATSAGSSAFTHCLGEFAYVEGEMYDIGLRKLVERGDGVAAIAQWAKRWVELLADSADSGAELLIERMLPPNFIDCVPFNLVRGSDGALHFIDQEWVADGPVPVSWVLVRGLVYSLNAIPSRPSLCHLTYREAVIAIAAEFGVEIETRHLATAVDWEEDFYRYVNGISHEASGEDRGGNSHLSRLIDQPIRRLEAQRIDLDHLPDPRAIRVEEEALQLRRALAETQHWRHTAEFARASMTSRYDRLRGVAERMMRRRSILVRRKRAAEQRGRESRELVGTLQRERLAHSAELRALQAEREVERAAVKRGGFNIREFLSTHPKLHELRTGSGVVWTFNELEQVLESGLFDSEYYQSQTGWKRATPAQLFQHYLTDGWRIGLQPHYLFDSRYYLRQRPDLIAHSYNPLLHYLRCGLGEGAKPHPLFDPQYYFSEYGALIPSGQNPLIHYLHHGLQMRLRPCGLFDPDWYLRQNPTLLAHQLNPLVHYVRCGWKEGTEPCPLFDGAHFVQTGNIVLRAGESPLAHFVELSLHWGGAGGISPSPLVDLEFLQSQVAIHSRPHELLGAVMRSHSPLAASPCVLFDPEFYERMNGDVSGVGLPPFFHYLRFGASERRDPHPLFDSSYYLSRLPLAERDRCLNPLLHYFTTPVACRISPHPLFDREYYLQRYGKLLAAEEDPLLHFVRWGDQMLLSPNPQFDAEFYLHAHGDIRSTSITPFQHFLRDGAREGRKSVRAQRRSGRA